ncbi:MAG: CotH kinase family protein [Candidatus Krumholzibacteria bacterium]|nr:CotH kinase family protein [Candidatus Krumholzibacteria bacterium]
MIVAKPAGRLGIFRKIRRLPARTTFIIIGLLMYSGGVFLLGAIAHRDGFFGEVKSSSLRDRFAAARNYVTSFSQRPQQILIDIKHKHFQKLAHDRQVALATGRLMTDRVSEVPATIRYGDESIPIKIRLKGDLKDHYEHPYRWSFRIQTRKERTLFGMKRFSIQRPQTRRWVYEWLFHQVARREDLIALRYRFIDVTINGRKLGIYALEEHFDKRLIEHNRRREGPVLRFDESSWWAERAGFERAMQKSWPGTGDYHSSHIDMFGTKHVIEDPTLFPQFETAVNLLEGFRNGRLSTSEVFNVKKLATYIALCDLFGSEHPLSMNQFRCYYDPIASRLEPIPFDIGGGVELNRISSAWSRDLDTIWHGGRRVMFLHALFGDMVFFEQYVRELQHYSQPAYLDSLFEELGDELEQNIALIHRSYPGYHFSNRVLYENQLHIRRYLNPVKGFHAYFAGHSEHGIDLELGNIQHVPVELVNLSYQDSLVFLPQQETILPGRDRSYPVRHERVAFTFPDGFRWMQGMVGNLKVSYRLLGTDDLRSETVFPWLPIDENILTNDLMQQPANTDDFDFLRIDEVKREIVIRTGRWNVAKNMIIPTGYRLIAGEGVELNLTNSATILSYSPLTLLGSEEAPILLHSADGTGQGMIVVDAGEKSLVEYVRFDNLSNPSQARWKLTGAVTFYESPVAFVNCHFTRNRSEDALNVVRSRFSIRATVFSKIAADALDADFTEGQIGQTSFVNCANDALDVSGSVVNMEDVVMMKIGDKGISVGENSRLLADRVRIQNAAIAVAGKDMSDLVLKNIEISDGDVGIAVFQKKAEFGGASATVTNLRIDRVKIPYLIEQDSQLTVDEQALAANHAAVEGILYGTVYGKSSE